MADRVLPHSLEAEESVLGAILIDNAAFHEAVSAIDASAFFRKSHALIFDAMVALNDRQQPIELVTLVEELRRTDKLDACNGAAAIASLVDGVPRSTNVSYYAGIVKEKATLRNLIFTASGILEHAYEAAESADAIVEQAERMVMSVGRASTAGGDFVLADDWMHETWALVDRANLTKRVVTGVPSGLSKLDLWTRGWQPSDLIYLGARPSAGKTSLALQLALEASKHTMAGLISMEMSRRVVGMRAIALEAGLDAFRLMTGQLSPYEFKRAEQARDAIQARRFAIDDATGVTATQLRAKVRRFASRYGLGIVFIDYMQLLHESGDFESRNTELARISAGLKSLARELDIPVFVLSQLSRASVKESGGPQAHNLRDCLPGSALLAMADGSRRSIASLVGTDVTGAQVVALNDVWCLEPKGVCEVWPVGKRQMVVITTSTGRRLRCSTEHKLFTENGWQPAHQIAVGTLAGVPRVVPRFSRSAPSMTADQALLLGWITGDGNLQGSAQLTVVDTTEAEFAASLGRKCFQIEPRIGKEHDRTTAKRVTFTTGRPSGPGQNPMTRWLRELGVWGVTGTRKHVPELLFSQSNEVIAAYLQGLFHADGTLAVSKAKNRPTLKLTTISESLARSVQDLLTRLGIVSCVSAHRHTASGFRTKNNIGWTVAIHNNAEIHRFLERVGFLLDKHDRAMARCRRTRDGGSSHIDRLPAVVNERVTALRHARKWSHADLGWRVQGKAMSRRQCALLALKLNDTTLSRWAHSDVLWDRIVSIEAAPDEDCYDITVSGLHNFIVDGFITHNSGALEQDADVVLLLHRPNQHDEQKRLEDGDPAQLIIAKQRNGPTGSIKLQWIGEQMRFGEEASPAVKQPAQAAML